MSDDEKLEVVFWDCDDGAEIFSHTTKEGAIEAYLDGIDLFDGKIKAYGYARMVVPKPTMEDAVILVEDWFESHWEELQGDDGPDAPNSTCEAALAFLTVLHKNFVPWVCEIVTSEEVDIAEWIRTHRADWLDKNKV